MSSEVVYISWRLELCVLVEAKGLHLVEVLVVVQFWSHTYQLTFRTICITLYNRQQRLLVIVEIIKIIVLNALI